MDKSLIFLSCMVLLILIRIRTWMDNSLSLLKRTTFTQIQRLTRFEKICYRRIKVILIIIINLINIDVLHVNSVPLHALPKPLLFNLNPDLMVQEEQLDMILIWQNVFIVDFVKLHVQLTLLFKDQTFKIQQWLIKNYSMIKKNY